MEANIVSDDFHLMLFQIDRELRQLKFDLEVLVHAATAMETSCGMVKKPSFSPMKKDSIMTSTSYIAA